MITSQYRLLGLLGHPTAHSLSPVFQNAALQHEGLPYVYLAFDVSPDQLERAVESSRTLKVAGWNVTVPHKETIIPLLDRLDETASLIQAVNTVVNRDGVLTGFNTDPAGLQITLQRHSFKPREPVIVLGAGGAARAVLYALNLLQSGPVTVYNRTPDRARKLREWAQSALHRDIFLDPWESLVRGTSPALAEASTLINATSLGLRAEIPPLPWDQLRQCRLVIDTVYRKTDTPLVRTARDRGLTACDGKTMLIGQGAESFHLFTGHQAPVEIMERALEENHPPCHID